MADRSVRVGVALTTSMTPVFDGPGQRDYVVRVAEAADELGFDSIWVSDRTVYPVDLAKRYPLQFGPGAADPRGQNVLEALTTLSYVAGIARRPRLGLSVLVLPFRNAVLNAKMLTTLDLMSGGRLIVGAGTGWMAEEFEAMGSDYGSRGRQTDEHIEAFKALCRGASSYSGSHVSFENVSFHPLPAQQPHPPVWIGGNSDAALRRTARLGDGWHGTRLTPDEVAYRRKRLIDMCETAGRKVDIAVSIRHTLRYGAPDIDMDGLRATFSGDGGHIARDIAAYERAGVTHVVLSIAAKSTDETVDVMRAMSKEVLR